MNNLGKRKAYPEMCSVRLIYREGQYVEWIFFYLSGCSSACGVVSDFDSFFFFKSSSLSWMDRNNFFLLSCIGQVHIIIWHQNQFLHKMLGTRIQIFPYPNFLVVYFSSIFYYFAGYYWLFITIRVFVGLNLTWVVSWWQFIKI